MLSWCAGRWQVPTLCLLGAALWRGMGLHAGHALRLLAEHVDAQRRWDTVGQCRWPGQRPLHCTAEPPAPLGHSLIAEPLLTPLQAAKAQHPAAAAASVQLELAAAFTASWKTAFKAYKGATRASDAFALNGKRISMAQLHGAVLDQGGLAKVGQRVLVCLCLLPGRRG